MSIQLAIAEKGRLTGFQQEFHQDRGAALQTQSRSEIKAEVFEKIASSLPGNNTGEGSMNILSAEEDSERFTVLFNTKLKFYVDPESQEVIVKVIDSETDKVIKVLPPEELQRLHARLKEAMGFLFDEQV
jgi:flagellar protein FlaG